MNEVRVGVAIAVINEHNQVLIGRRLSPLGLNKFSFPGGHLEFNESIDACIRRELLEETAIYWNSGTDFIAISEDIHTDLDKHYVTIFHGVKMGFTPEAKLTEPDKCECWVWIDIDMLRDMELFSPVAKLIKSPAWKAFIDG